MTVKERLIDEICAGNEQLESRVTVTERAANNLEKRIEDCETDIGKLDLSELNKAVELLMDEKAYAEGLEAQINELETDMAEMKKNTVTHTQLEEYVDGVMDGVEKRSTDALTDMVKRASNVFKDRKDAGDFLGT